MATQEKLSHAMVQSQNLREERDLLKGVEQRLLLEKESMLREHRSQNLLMNNLQAIQVCGIWTFDYCITGTFYRHLIFRVPHDSPQKTLFK